MTYQIVYNIEPDETLGQCKETVEGVDLGDGRVRLTSHASLIPLCPGDVVSVVGDMVMGLVGLAPVYTMEVAFFLPADLEPYQTPTEEHRSMRAVAASLEAWREAGAAVTRTTNFSALVTSADDQWLIENVGDHRFVEYAEMIRTPVFRMSYDVAIKHPDLDGSGEGPWA